MINRLYFYVSLFILIVCVGCEVVDESTLPSHEDVVLVDMSFMAAIEDETWTKTLLDGKLEDDMLRVLWQPDDRIGLIAVNSDSGEAKMYELMNTVDEPSESVVFTGTTPIAPNYWALYPYDDDSHADLSKGTLEFDLPAVQNYVEGSFDPGSTPMVARAGYGQPLSFKNLCGLLALQLTGDVEVESIVFIGKDANGKNMPVCGSYSVDMNYESVPEIKRNSNDEAGTIGASVTLMCDVPVQLNAEEAIPFYIVLPPATYSTFVVMITTSDGNIMIREGKNPLTIKRSDVQPTDNLGYEEAVYVDLSERGTSNCYIVSEPGLYTFDATVIGNGDFGIIESEGFHTDNPEIEPTEVELLWEDTDGLIHNLAYNAGKISFIATGLEGNALIAAKDAAGTILWSWHIWMTDQPADQNYENDALGSFVMLDRNIGAIRADCGTGDEWKDAVGTLYQWGRKDPFVQNLYTSGNKFEYYSDSVSEPTFFENSWYNIDAQVWTPDIKTIYDPCPVGYRVPSTSVFSGMNLSNLEEIYDKGFALKHSNDILSIFPMSAIIERGSYEILDYCELFLCNSVQNYAYTFYLYSTEIEVHNTHRHKNCALPVRCIKDVNYVDVSRPQVSVVDVDNITTDRAKLTASIISSGMSSVSKVGFIYGKTEDLSDGEIVLCNELSNDFSADISNLTYGTTYYVKSFAENDRGISYGPLTTFMTLLAEDIIHLSAKGTANCYIVTNAGKYTFSVVQGNTKDSVGVPASAEVIWETKNTNSDVTVGDVIKSVSYRDSGVVLFETSEMFVKGNALIAVKDVSGNILWSWHIWLTDMPQECVYANDAGVMMDRNIGAISATAGEVEALGLLYQWGRKDPFLNSASVDSYIQVASTLSEWNKVDTSSSSGTIDYATKYPTTVIYNSSISTGSNYDWFYTSKTAAADYSRWLTKKTKYDPCPVGWKVPDGSVWETAGFNNAENYSYVSVGNYFKFNDNCSTPATWYPITSYILNYSGEHYISNSIHYFSVEPLYNNVRSIKPLYLYYSDNVASVNSTSIHASKASACPVRCMKDE